VTRSGDDWTKLAPAGRCHQKRALLRHGVDTAHDSIGCRGELTHLTALHLAIHLRETRTKRLIQPGPLDVFGDANDLERSGGGVVNLGSHREEESHSLSRLLAGVDNAGSDPAAFEGVGYSADLLS
jgi:hypothetical protein